MRLALAQINTVVGDLDGNADKIRRRLAEAKDRKADLVVFPELAVTGYPPEDLLLRPSFVQAAQAKAEALAREARGIVALIGVPWFDRDLYNACAVCAAGEIKTIYRKRFLPNYGVFDEEGHLLARGPSFEEALLVVDIEPADAIGRRLRDVRRRALARDRLELPDLPAVHVGSAHGPRERVTALIAPRLDELEQMRV